MTDIERIKNLKGLVNDTIWLSVEQMAELFQRDRSVIGKHIRNVFKEIEKGISMGKICPYCR